MTIKPTPPSTAFIGETPVQIEWIQYMHQLQSWCDHIEALHANQTQTGMDLHRTIDELRHNNETQMTIISDGQVEKALVDEELIAQKKLVAALEADVATISNELNEEAKRRDWCDDYLTFCNRVNELLKVGRLGPERRPYIVKHTYTVTIEGRIDARSDDDAADAAGRQYNGIVEAEIMAIPDNMARCLSGEDRGELVSIRWEHADSFHEGEA